MDFIKIRRKMGPRKQIELYTDFQINRGIDIMIRGKSFYAIWDEEKGLWSTDELDVQRLVDKELREYLETHIHPNDRDNVTVKYLRDFSSNAWMQYRKMVSSMFDNSHTLDEKLTFANDKVKKEDYVSRRLPYALEKGSIAAWDKLVGTLYSEEERQKIEWAIGSIVSGESKDIQKFFVFYGSSGTGKSTILNIIQKLFVGYYTVFESRALGSRNNSFSMEMFRTNPLVAIEHDGDLSRIEDNTKINSIVAHEEMMVNEKFKAQYSLRANCLLFIGSNKPVSITDAKSGLIRRLIDIRPSNNLLSREEYDDLMFKIEFELGAIAYHCREVFNNLGKAYYDPYRPKDMQLHTDIFYNFVFESAYIFKSEKFITLSRAWELYKKYCDDSMIEHKMQKHRVRDELKNYFRLYDEEKMIDGQRYRYLFREFLDDKFSSHTHEKPKEQSRLNLDSSVSILDKSLSAQPAQYATEEGIPAHRWTNVSTTLADLDTTKLHYVVLPENHIYIDFDLKDESGEKSQGLNLEEANKWPPTYAEYSKSGKGIHLHYIYDGDVSQLSNLYSEGIEIKRTIVGDKGPSSLRRKLSLCNNIPIAHINGGLPLKGAKMIDAKAVASEKGLRDLIIRNLNKEIHPGTKPSIDFIHKILEDAYSSGLKYDVTQLRPKVLAFANNSTNQADYCVKLVAKMKFKSEDKEEEPTPEKYEDDSLVFYDVEVFSNLFIVCWKRQGVDQKVVRMINPSASEIEKLMEMKLVGFNNRRYDNHILYGRYIGYSNEELFKLSMKIVSNESQNGYFREAYNLSYADIYDFSSIKKSLKAFQIDLGIHHKELGIPWDQPIPEDRWLEAAEYCENDVISTEAVFEDRKQDFVARQILAELSGLTVNDTTQQHTARIIFGKDPEPQKHFVYTDLSTLFPGYIFDSGKSTYRGEEVGEGGYVYAEPGIYSDVALLDVASMHPASLENLNLFGPYTKTFSALKAARIAIKHKDFESAKGMLGGILSKYLTSTEQADALAYALKIVINIVYGLTSASFPNKFRDPRNIDNIVAKRGALFMIDLKHAVQEKGYQVAHIKTDSIKIPNATTEIISFVFEFGKKYGYDFEHEATFSRFCLVNDAVYIAKYKDGKKAGTWSATGAQFAHPFVFKSLFSKEPIEFLDLCEAKSVTGNSALYLDMNEGLEDVSAFEKELQERTRVVGSGTGNTPIKLNSKFSKLSDEDLKKKIEKGHNYQFVGKVGLFCPVEPGTGGGLLMREKGGKYYAATGTKGYRWLEAEVVKDLGITDQIDTAYHESLVSDAIEHISKFGDFEKFVSDTDQGD